MNFREISATELNLYLQNSTAAPLLLDVREPWEFEKCSLENSQLIPMRQIPSILSQLDPDQETIVICHHGIRSRSVAAYLSSNAFTNVINLTGGIDAWAKYVDQSMPTY
ncbi:MAG: rhodanese-like domain-containing protein [Gammaproteobacteria bacterium]|nr:rhodanese-like domain-containing protein [Gammaproteobacteria bacterium]